MGKDGQTTERARQPSASGAGTEGTPEIRRRNEPHFGLKRLYLIFGLQANTPGKFDSATYVARMKELGEEGTA